MASAFEQILIDGLRTGVEVKLGEICNMEEFASLGAIAACVAIEERLEANGLSLNPSIDTGGLDDVRIVQRQQSEDFFQREYDKAVSFGEGGTVEFKESLHLKKNINYELVPRAEHVADYLIHEVAKTISAFANADGGTLLIGVNDDGEPVGIDCELPYLRRGNNIDCWLLFFQNCLEKYIIDFRLFSPFLRWGVCCVGGVHIIVVVVRSRTTRLTICRNSKDKETEEVFLRRGSSSLRLRLAEIEELLRSRIEE